MACNSSVKWTRHHSRASLCRSAVWEATATMRYTQDRCTRTHSRGHSVAWHQKGFVREDKAYRSDLKAHSDTGYASHEGSQRHISQETWKAKRLRVGRILTSILWDLRWQCRSFDTKIKLRIWYIGPSVPSSWNVCGVNATWRPRFAMPLPWSPPSSPKAHLSGMDDSVKADVFLVNSWPLACYRMLRIAVEAYQILMCK